jgi:hypothetical protein
VPLDNSCVLLWFGSRLDGIVVAMCYYMIAMETTRSFGSSCVLLVDHNIVMESVDVLVAAGGTFL